MLLAPLSDLDLNLDVFGLILTSCGTELIHSMLQIFLYTHSCSQKYTYYQKNVSMYFLLECFMCALLLTPLSEARRGYTKS